MSKANNFKILGLRMDVKPLKLGNLQKRTGQFRPGRLLEIL